MPRHDIPPRRTITPPLDAIEEGLLHLHKSSANLAILLDVPPGEGDVGHELFDLHRGIGEQSQGAMFLIEQMIETLRYERAQRARIRRERWTFAAATAVFLFLFGGVFGAIYGIEEGRLRERTHMRDPMIPALLVRHHR